MRKFLLAPCLIALLLSTATLAQDNIRPIQPFGQDVRETFGQETNTPAEVRPYCVFINCDLPEQEITVWNPHTRRKETAKGSWSKGSGSIVSKEYVLTNGHVVHEYLDEIEAGHNASLNMTFSDGSTRSGEVVKISKEYDLALISVFGDLNKGLHRVPIAKDWKDAKSVTVCGFPMARYSEVVGGKVRKEERLVAAFAFEGIYIVGISGSPVLNEDGYLCGVIFGSDYDLNLKPPFAGYATTVHEVRGFLAGTGILELKGNN